MLVGILCAGFPGLVAFISFVSTPVLLGGMVGVLFAGWLLTWMRSRRWKIEASRVRATLDSLAAPVLVIDDDLSIVDVNSRAAGVLGLRRRTPRRQRLLDLVPPSSDLTADAILENLRRETTCIYKGAVSHGDRAAQEVRVRLSTLDGTGGRRVVALLEDVSEERAQAAHYERFLDYLIQNVPVEVAILAPDGRYRYLSSAFLIDEQRRQWLIGRTDFEYCKEFGLHTEIALKRRAHRMEAVDRLEAVHFEEEISWNGESRYLSWTYVPFTGDDDEVMLVLGFGLDRTDLVRCRADLQLAHEESLKAGRLKETLLQNVTHEVRTPLTGILGTAQMLRSEIDPALREFIENIQENAERLSRTLTDMMDLAGLQSEVAVAAPVVLDLGREVEDVVRTLRPAAERRGLFLEYSASEPELLVHADREALARCIKNLVDNAVKFTDHGGVAVDVSQRDEYAYVRVMDTGVGIGRSMGRDVFEAFQQEDVGMDRAFEGAGLGLAVTERMLHAMDGDIRVHSRKGAGSSFVMRLPLAIPRLKKGRATRPVLLLADAQEESHRLVAHMIRDLADVRSAFRLDDLGREDGRSIDAAVVDARFCEGRTLAETAQRIRALPSLAGAQLILMDFDSGSAHRRVALESGWDDVLPRPVTKLALLNVLTGIFSSAVEQPRAYVR